MSSKFLGPFSYSSRITRTDLVPSGPQTVKVTLVCVTSSLTKGFPLVLQSGFPLMESKMFLLSITYVPFVCLFVYFIMMYL